MRKIAAIYIILFCYQAYPQATELLRNGDFSNDRYWNAESGWSISNDSARYLSQASAFSLSQLDTDMISSVKPNTTYLLRFDLISEGIARIAPQSSNGKVYYSSEPVSRTYSRSGSKWMEFTTPSNIGIGGFSLTAYADYSSFIIDNISLMEVAAKGTSPYYVAVNGNDAASGNIKNPWKTPEKAFREAQAGDTVFFRGGRYLRTMMEGGIHVVYKDSADTGEDICNSGEPGNYIHFWGYPSDVKNGDSVIFDFSFIEPPRNGGNNTGFYFAHAGYVHFKNLTFRNVWQKYEKVVGYGINCYAPHNMIYENIVVDTIGGIGMFSSTYDWDARGRSDTTYFINCDFHNCIDSLAVGDYQIEQGWAGTQGVGLFAVSYPGCYYVIDGCRSWRNADDGFNFVPSGGEVRVNNSWSFKNGAYFDYLDFHSAGNGYKLNSSGNIEGLQRNPSNISHYVTNSISALNNGLGFTENKGANPSMNRRMYNNIAYKNWQGFTVSGSDPEGWEHRNNAYINNIAYENDIDVGEYRGGYFHTNDYNSWNENTEILLTKEDFISVDSSVIFRQLSGQRQKNGSLPILDSAFQLSEGSSLIDAGTDVGLPYNGSKPDLGPFEYKYQPGTNNEYPSVEINSPSDGSRYEKKNALTISVEASDDEGISTLELYNNDTLLEVTSYSTLTYLWVNPPNETFSFRAVATDNQGAKATSSLVSVTIDSAGVIAPVKQNCFEVKMKGNYMVADSFILEFPEGLPVNTLLSITNENSTTKLTQLLTESNDRIEHTINVSNLIGMQYYFLDFSNSKGLYPCESFESAILKK